MASEASIVKAHKYLTEGKVTLLEVSDDGCTASAQGSGDTPYEVIFNGGWSCDCPARKTECAHVVAVKLVTDFHSSKPHFKADPEIDELLGV